MAEKFNERNPPKKASYVACHLIEMIDRPRAPIGHLEPLMQGEFTKYNNNDGLILAPRNTPQAFSHFTYENSDQQLVVVDVQGVEDLYTDPQIHTSDYQGFGIGNLGQKGILKFLITHQCNPVCRAIGLTPLSHDRSETALSKDMAPSGTMPKPDMSHFEGAFSDSTLLIPLPSEMESQFPPLVPLNFLSSQKSEFFFKRVANGK